MYPLQRGPSLQFGSGFALRGQARTREVTPEGIDALQYVPSGSQGITIFYIAQHNCNNYDPFSPEQQGADPLRKNLEYTSAGDCMTEITSIMNVVPEIHLTMSPKDIEGLFLNVMLMIMNPPTVARAA